MPIRNQRAGAINDFVKVTSAHTVLNEQMVQVDTTSGAVTITLPPSLAQPVPRRFVEVRDIGGNAATNNITVTPNGADTINGVAGSFTITQAYASATFIDTGSGWQVAPAGSGGTLSSLTVTGALVANGTVTLNGNTTSTGAITSNGTLTANGNTTLANANNTYVSFGSATLAAAGTVIGNATVLSHGVNFVTVGSANQGVQLPAGLAANTTLEISVTNTSANALLVYPPLGGAIGGLAANASYSLGANLTAFFMSANTTQWWGAKGN